MRVIFAFYQSFIPITLTVSLIGCVLIYHYGSWHYAIPILFMKVFVNGILALYTYYFNAGQFYFYHNLGFTRRILLVTTCVTDIIIWLLMTLFTLNVLL
ncbi:hypothetical protein [Chryseosolibacter indicus]|uniref:Uncharacterized protein n=1 Tax=Chryseosolibacter indicus TaxID=2782351 RepID=A0ABS5VQA1_9BACT|nr:hypothetical protein [Chryseosolibacter indicus]MBT1703618.1 hypothetical protein [Chryseosolibacter indicus]